ncbi:MAG: hypothetical protein FWD13_02265 [Treponema sp.]|nr:hypothetical protein [Treponema sp.]
MKKLIILSILLVLVMPVFAQNNSNSDDRDNIYYINVPVERIIPTSTGYVIQYRSSSSMLATVGIPNEWFTDAASSAEIIRLPPGLDWPTMSVFYRNGEFSHVKLYVHRSRAHITWGNIPQGTDVSRFFTDKESFKMNF